MGSIKHIGATKIFVLLLLLAYLAILLKVLVFKYPGVHFAPEYNFIPFKTILPYLTGYPNWIVARDNLLGNILTFMPLGVLLPFLYRRVNWKHVLAAGFIVSLGIEVLQIILHKGSFDIDDILLNTLGAILGYCVFVAAVRVAKAGRIRYGWNMKKMWVVLIAAVAVVICGLFAWQLHSRLGASTSPRSLNITTTTGNYGLFIDNQDNEYFSTHDANVRNIIQAYLAPQYIGAKTDAEKYGNSLIYYYTKDRFIAAGLYLWSDLNNISGFSMFDAKTGKLISDCQILGAAGLYKDADLLISVSYKDNGIQGICFYDRGAPNFTFVDLTPQLSKNETLFDDPAGRNLHASLHKTDNDQSVLVDVYDTTKRDAKGNYAYKRSIKVGYEITPTKLGVQDPIDQTILGRGFVPGTNSWKGYIDGTLTAVTGTAEYDNPSQGVVFIWEPDNGVGTVRSYPAPTATGPLKIISQQNDVLVLQSVAGTYEVYDINTDTRKYVTTKGGTTYTFDIRGRKFVQ